MSMEAAHEAPARHDRPRLPGVRDRHRRSPTTGEVLLEHLPGPESPGRALLARWRLQGLRRPARGLSRGRSLLLAALPHEARGEHAGNDAYKRFRPSFEGDHTGRRSGRVHALPGSSATYRDRVRPGLPDVREGQVNAVTRAVANAYVAVLRRRGQRLDHRPRSRSNRLGAPVQAVPERSHGTRSGCDRRREASPWVEQPGARGPRRSPARKSLGARPGSAWASRSAARARPWSHPRRARR